MKAGCILYNSFRVKDGFMFTNTFTVSGFESVVGHKQRIRVRQGDAQRIWHTFVKYFLNEIGRVTWQDIFEVILQKTNNEWFTYLMLIYSRQNLHKFL